MRATCEPDPVTEIAMRDAIKNAPFQPYEIHSNNNKNLIHMEKKAPTFSMTEDKTFSATHEHSYANLKKKKLCLFNSKVLLQTMMGLDGQSFGP